MNVSKKSELWLTILSVPLVSGLLVLAFLVLPTTEHETAEAKEELIEAKTATILFVGDIMLDRYIRTNLDTKGATHVLGAVRPLLEGADLAVGNLEGPITSEPSKSVGTKMGETSNTHFTFAPPVASMLAAYGFDVLSIGNNHIRDFGIEGVESTKRHLEDAGLDYVGDPFRMTPEPVVREVNGIKIAFVSFNQFIEDDTERMLQAVRDGARQADAVIVLPHWGEEYTSVPPLAVRALASRMAEAGATAVMGTHSHVVGLTEDIGETRVYYSLGNFVFDQYFSPDTQCGRAVTLTITKGKGKPTFAYAETDIGLLRGGATVLGCS